MTVSDLKEILEDLIEEGKGDYDVCFDDYMVVNEIMVYDAQEFIDLNY